MQAQKGPDSRSATRIQLRKGRGEERIAKLQDSPDMPEGEATYCLKSGYVLTHLRLADNSGWEGELTPPAS